MKIINTLNVKKAVVGGLLTAMSALSVHAQLVCDGRSFNGPRNPGWRDSVSVGGRCYCVTTFDHNIGALRPAGGGGLTVRQICDLIGPPPAGNQIPYNDVQCGHGPANDAGDEDADCCPGRVDQGPSGCLTLGPRWDLSSITGGSNQTIVTMQKRDARAFALDGGAGGSRGQNIDLRSFNVNDSDQRWVEINQGNGFFSYRKQGTNFAIDGGNGGARNQNVHLWTYNVTNRNQHFRKVRIAGSSFQLRKRNAQAFSIDGRNGRSNGSNVVLWNSQNNRQQQHWVIRER